MKCDECRGTGVAERIEGHELPCPVCDGHGVLKEALCECGERLVATVEGWYACPVCDADEMDFGGQ